MISKLFRSRREIKAIEEKNELEMEIESLKNKIRKMESIIRCKNSLNIDKEKEEKQNEEWKCMEEKLKKYYKENNELRDFLKQNEKIIPRIYLNYNFFMPIEKYFPESRFMEAVEKLKNTGNEYLQNLNENTIEGLSVDRNLKLELKNKLNRFQNLEVNWEIKTYLIKGEKTTRIFTKYRKFINILLNENKEFMGDLLEYNFNKLIDKGYSVGEIDDLKEIYHNYILKFRIEINGKNEEKEE